MNNSSSTCFFFDIVYHVRCTSFIFSTAKTRLPLFIILYSLNDKTWTNRPNNNSFRKDTILVRCNELENMIKFHLPMIVHSTERITGKSNAVKDNVTDCWSYITHIFIIRLKISSYDTKISSHQSKSIITPKQVNPKFTFHGMA